MQSTSTLSKCFSYVSNLSKKLFSVKQPVSHSIKNQLANSKSIQNELKDQMNKHVQNENKSKNNAQQIQIKQQRPKIITFKNFSKTQSASQRYVKFYKNRKSSLALNRVKSSLQNLCSNNQLLNQKNERNSSSNYSKIEYFSNGIKKFDTNIVSKISGGIIAPKLKNKVLETVKQNQQNQYNNILRNQKKNTKLLKKTSKQSKSQKYLQLIDEKQIINSLNQFKYDDGDDISSISWNNQTTDDLQPQLLSFVRQKIIKNNIQVQQQTKKKNMKKKKGFIQILTVQQVCDQASKQIILDQNLHNYDQQLISLSNNQQISTKRKRKQLNLSGKVSQTRRKIMHKYNTKDLNQSNQNDHTQQFGSKKKHEISYVNQKQQNQQLYEQLNYMDEEEHKQPELELEIMAQQEKYNHSKYVKFKTEQDYQILFKSNLQEYKQFQEDF